MYLKEENACQLANLHRKTSITIYLLKVEHICEVIIAWPTTFGKESLSLTLICEEEKGTDLCENF